MMNFITALIVSLLAANSSIQESPNVIVERMTIVIVPHGDDEVTLLPLIQASGDRAIVVVMTDGAASSRCYKVADCAKAREDSTRGFLREQAPQATVLWIGLPDKGLSYGVTRELVEGLLYRWPDATLWAAGRDYGHHDHNVVRAVVGDLGGILHSDTMMYEADAQLLDTLSRWYGWLGPFGPGSFALLGVVP